MIHMNINGRLGNQFFQFWVGCYLSQKLKRKLKLFFYFKVDLDFENFKNIPTFEFAPYVKIEKHDPANGFFLGSTTNLHDIEKNFQNNATPIFIEMYFEEIFFIELNSKYIKYLFESKTQKDPTNDVVIHFRLGDLESQYIHIYDRFNNFCHKTIKEKYSNLQIKIVTEDPKHINVSINY